MNSEISVAQVERWASALGGAAPGRVRLKRLREEISGGHNAGGRRRRPHLPRRDRISDPTWIVSALLLKTSSWAGLRDGGVDQPLRLFDDADVARH